LLHPNNKFWEVALNGVNVTFRVGKIKEGAESNEEQVDKRYPSMAAAKVSVVQKITEKLTKGYISRDAKAVSKK
jgi:predicted DNA-binding WGR domain protein